VAWTIGVLVAPAGPAEVPPWISRVLNRYLFGDTLIRPPHMRVRLLVDCGRRPHVQLTVNNLIKIVNKHLLDS
jgi:hypothetical protein